MHIHISGFLSSQQLNRRLRPC